MDTKYKSPRMRARMSSLNPDDGASETPAPAGQGDAPPQDAPPKESSSVSVFIPKGAQGGKEWKPGDEIVMQVKDVDPESGELEVVYAPEKGVGEEDDTMSAMDKAMPADDSGE